MYTHFAQCSTPSNITLYTVQHALLRNSQPMRWCVCSQWTICEHIMSLLWTHCTLYRYKFTDSAVVNLFTMCSRQLTYWYLWIYNIRKFLLLRDQNARYSAVCDTCIYPLSAVEQWSVGDPVEVGDSVGDQAQLPLTHLLLTATFPPLPLTFQLGTMILNFSECIQVSLILTVAFICCVRELLMHLM